MIWNNLAQTSLSDELVKHHKAEEVRRAMIKSGEWISFERWATMLASVLLSRVHLFISWIIAQVD